MSKDYLKKLLKYMKEVYHIEDAIRHTLKVVDNRGLSKMHNNIIKKAKQNKVLRSDTIDGYTVAAIDGTKLFGITAFGDSPLRHSNQYKRVRLS
jgi:hypothetical protein